MIKRPWRLCAALLAKAVLLGVLSLAASYFPAPAPAVAAQDDVEYNGKLYCTVMFPLSLDYPGTIEKVLVAPGDQVKAGQVLARYRLKDEAALGILGYLDMGRVTATELSIAGNDEDALKIREEYAAARRLSAAQIGSAEHLNRLQQNLELLRKQKALLERRLESDKRDLLMRRKVIKDKLGVAVEGNNIPEYGELRSPQAGEALLIDPSLREGMLLHGPLHSAVTLARTNPMEVRTQVFESEIPRLKVGGKAVVRVVSLDERKYDGVITRIDRSPGSMSVESPSYYNVHVEIANDDGKLRPGFKALVRFVPESKGQ